MEKGFLKITEAITAGFDAWRGCWNLGLAME
jgi:hypothetical protein